MPYRFNQTGIFLRTFRYRLMQPLVQPCSGHLQHAAHQHQRKLVPMFVHEPVLYSGSLAKYRAAFLADSSSSRRRIWDRSRRISLFASTSSALCFSSLVGMNALTHLYKLWADTPQSGRNLGSRVTPLDDLANCLFLEFRHVTLCAHLFLLCSNHRSEMSTGVGGVKLLACSKNRGITCRLSFT